MEKMKPRDRLLNILQGKKPDKVPFMPFSELVPRGEFVREMRNNGMGLITHATSLWSEMPNVSKTEEIKNGLRIMTYHTPVGDVSEAYSIHVGKISNNSTVQKEYLIKDINDYEPVIFMLDDTTFNVDEGEYKNIEQQLGSDGLAHTWTDEPGYMESQYFLGLEKWTYEQYDHPAEFSKLLEAIERRQERRLMKLLDCPERYLINLGNLAGNFGVEQYRKYILPYYQKYVPLFREKGKICTIHADALNLNAYKDIINETGIDIIEAFTPPPVGDLSLRKARETWGEEMVIWINFPETVFYEGYEKTKQYTIDLIKSDQNWRKFIGMTEMGLMGADSKTYNIFKQGFKAILDGINECPY